MIKLLIPDLPTTDQIKPWLMEIDQQCWYTNFGPLVRNFESSVQRRLSCIAQSGAEVVSVSSGTLALELALRLLKLPRGAKVLLPSFNFPAAAHVILNSSLTPVFSEVDPDLWVLTPDIAREALKHTHVDAIIPTAAFGHPLQVEAWDDLTESTQIPVIIDAAAAFGYQQVGTRTTVVFSLHATKPFGIGEGGLIASADKSLIERARKASNFGYDNHQIEDFGLNAKMSEYHAAVALAQLERWPDIQETRSRLWALYGEALQQVPGVVLPTEFYARPLSVLQVRLPVDAKPIARHLSAREIETRRWYCPPLHQKTAFQQHECIGLSGQKNLDFTDELARNSLGLPFHTSLLTEDIALICNSLAEILADTDK